MINSFCRVGNLDERLSRASRIRRQQDFDRVYRSGFFAADQVLVIRAVPNGKNQSRLGLAISRKVGNAVVRNRWKRMIREVFRRNPDRYRLGLDLVIRPRKGAECVYANIEKSLPKLIKLIEKRIQKSSRG